MNYDAIVIGAGGMGSAALYHLAKRGVKTLGIEQFGLAHALGSSHGQTRVIRKAYFEHPSYVPLLEKAYRHWSELEEEAGKRVSNYCGMIYAGTSASGAVTGVTRSSELYGVPLERLSNNDLCKRYPQFTFNEEIVGLYEPTGGLLWVEECIKTHCELARRHGATIHANETVRQWKYQNGGYQVVTEKGEYTSKALLICAGAWTQPILQSLQLPLTIQRIPSGWFQPQHGDYTIENGFVIFGIETPDGFYYGFPVLDERGVKIAQYEGRQNVESANSIERNVNENDLDHVKSFISQYLPGVSQSASHASICIYTVTPDKHFIIDQHPEHENLYIAAGFSGHGFKFSSAVGAITADLVTKGQTNADIGLFKLSRFNA